MKIIILSCVTLLTLLLSSCYYDNLGELKPETALTGSTCDTASAISYTNQIVPLLQASCTAGCHNGLGSGHNIKNYAAISADALSGSLLGSVKWLAPFQQMPQGASSKISECDIAKIRLWVAQGAPNN